MTIKNESLYVKLVEVKSLFIQNQSATLSMLEKCERVKHRMMPVMRC
jgi:hypothetical protein